MRAAVIVLFVLVTASPSHASKSCMTMAEARAQFATSHLWWHGSGHCWDATPPQHRIVRRARPVNDAKDEQPAQDQQTQGAAAAQDDIIRPARREPRWRNAMSEMLPADAPVVMPSMPTLSSIAAPGLNWLDRWVDVAQVAPPSFLLGRAAAPEVSPTAGQKADPMVTPVRLIMVFLGIVVMLAVIELLFRNAIHERLD
jgi:hypothetical protein